MVVNLDNIRGWYSILTHNDYVVLFGKNLIIMKTDCTLVAHRKDLINVHKAVVLPEDTLLIDCGIPGIYALISLKDGSTCWQIDFPDMDIASPRFVVSPNFEYVYDFYRKEAQTYILRIDIAARKIATSVVRSKLRCTLDLVCNENGQLCLLQAHFEDTARFFRSINAIQYVKHWQSDGKALFGWHQRWNLQGPRISKYFLRSSKLVLTDDLFVCDLEKNETYNLLENDPKWQDPKRPPLYCSIDKKNRYIILTYDYMNAIIDWTARKMVARYASSAYSGALINDEFWICTNSGIIRKPFPLIEDLPPKKLSTF